MLIPDKSQQAFIDAVNVSTGDTGNIFVLTAGAGFGKTETLLSALMRIGGSSLGIFPTHKASNVLTDRLITKHKGKRGEDSSFRKILLPDNAPVDIRTVSSVLCHKPVLTDEPRNYRGMSFEEDISKQQGMAKSIAAARYSFIFIDEASMVGLTEALSLLRILALAKVSCPVVFCGDPNQLQPVGGVYQSQPSFPFLLENFTHFQLNVEHRSSGSDIALFANQLLRLNLDQAQNRASIRWPEETFKGVSFEDDRGLFSRKFAEEDNATAIAWKNKTCAGYEALSRNAGLYKYQQGDRVLVSNSQLVGEYDGKSCPILAYSSEEVTIREVYGQKRVNFPWLRQSFSVADVLLAKEGSIRSKRLLIVPHHLFCDPRGDIARSLSELMKLIARVAISLKEANPKTSRDAKAWISLLRETEPDGFLLINSTVADFEGIPDKNSLRFRHLVNRYAEQSPADFTFLLTNLLWARGFFAVREVCSFSVSPLSASTIHKSQGSEYEAVYLDARDCIGEKNLLQMIYTGATRARKKLVICR